MSAIKDGGYAITLKGKEYKLLFSLNVLDEIQDKFGAYDKLNEVFNPDNPNWIKDTKWLLAMLINEGLLVDDEDAKLLDEKTVGRLIHMGNIKEVQRAIFASFVLGNIGDEESDGDIEDIEEDSEGAGETKAVQED